MMPSDIEHHEQLMENVYKVVMSNSPFSSESAMEVAVTQNVLIAGVKSSLPMKNDL